MLALLLTSLGLALVLGGTALAWWRQRHALRSVRGETLALRRQLDSLGTRHEVLDSVIRQSALVGFRCRSVDGPLLLVGAGVDPLCGWSAQAIAAQGRRLIDLVDPADRLCVQAQLQQLVPAAPPTVVEFRLLHREGRSRWVSAQCALDSGGDGTPWITGTLLEVDRHKALQERLQQRADLYASLPGAAYRCTPDTNWTVEFISEGVLQLSGWSQADYLASPLLLRELVHPDDHQRVVDEIQAAADAQTDFTVEYRALHRDGHQFWAQEKGRAVRDAAGRVIWLDGVITDITERKALQQALREARHSAETAAASKTAFLANIGHEVRTPLNAIIGFSEIVLRNELDALQRQYVYKVRQAATALLQIMTDLLDLARLDRQQLQCASEAFSLRELAQQALAAQQDAARQKGLALRLDFEPGLADVFLGDAGRLRQVLDKLLDNAVKFTPQGAVRLQVARQQGQVLLAVHDTGIGIAPQDQERIFEAFSQADVSATRRYGGAGLGITLAHQLVERMGGSLGLHSSLGQGSVFRVLLPLAEAATAPEQPGAGEALPVEDDTPLDSELQALLGTAPGAAEQAWYDLLRSTIIAWRNGDRGDADLPTLLHGLRSRGLVRRSQQLESALGLFDLDLAASLLEALPQQP
ncbi:MAG TPA: ATP-binding protein [Pseudorhodoferax sp.]|nr:ATP-binding protein [Pseudorhodoferax sp.]